MKEAIIIHGSPDKAAYMSPDTPSPPAFGWFPWLQKQFQLKGVLAQAPSFPTPYAPKYEEWEELFGRIAVPNLTVVVAHSLGGWFIMRYLQSHPLKLERLVLVAPWLDTEGEFGEFAKIDFTAAALANIAEIHLFISDDDTPDQLESARVLFSAYPQIIEHRFKDKGHFTGDEKFPEILNAL